MMAWWSDWASCENTESLDEIVSHIEYRFYVRVEVKFEFEIRRMYLKYPGQFSMYRLPYLLGKGRL